MSGAAWRSAYESNYWRVTPRVDIAMCPNGVVLGNGPSIGQTSPRTAGRVEGAAAVADTTHFAVALLTGGSDKPYALGLASALASEGVFLDFIGSDELDCPEVHAIPNLRFLNLRGD